MVAMTAVVVLVHCRTLLSAEDSLHHIHLHTRHIPLSRLVELSVLVVVCMVGRVGGLVAALALGPLSRLGV